MCICVHLCTTHMVHQKIFPPLVYSHLHTHSFMVNAIQHPNPLDKQVAHLSGRTCPCKNVFSLHIPLQNLECLCKCVFYYSCLSRSSVLTEPPCKLRTFSVHRRTRGIVYMCTVHLSCQSGLMEDSQVGGGSNSYSNFNPNKSFGT